MRVQGSGFRVQGAGFRISEFRVQGSGSRVEGVRFKVEYLGFQVAGFRVQNEWFRVSTVVWRKSSSSDSADARSAELGTLSRENHYRTDDVGP